jgi:hypothetical protein
MPNNMGSRDLKRKSAKTTTTTVLRMGRSNPKAWLGVSRATAFTKLGWGSLNSLPTVARPNQPGASHSQTDTTHAAWKAEGG